MPKRIKEIRNFASGTILNSSEKDIPDTAASFSLNIDPMAKNGYLDSIRNDRIAASIDNNIIELSHPLSWNSTYITGDTNYTNSSSMNNEYRQVEFKNVNQFDNKSVAKLFFIGTEGGKEALNITNIQPLFNRLEVSDSYATPVYAAENVDSAVGSTNLNIDDGSGNDPYLSTASGEDALTVVFDDKRVYNSNDVLLGTVSSSTVTGSPSQLTFNGVINDISNNDVLYTRHLLSYNPPSNILTTDNVITCDNGLTNSESGLSGITSWTLSSSSVMWGSDNKADFNNGELTIKTPLGHSKTYLFTTSVDTSVTGFVGSGKVYVGISAASDKTAIANELIKAIEHPNGHNGEIRLTQITIGSIASVAFYLNVGSLPEILQKGDYVKFGTSTEIIHIDDVDLTNSQLTVTRGCFDTKISQIDTGTLHPVYANVEYNMGNKQVRHNKGTGWFYNWSSLKGNNIGGNSHYLETPNTANNGVIDTTGASTVTFGDANGAKKIGITNITNEMNFSKGDYITFYLGDDGDDLPNNGKTFKIEEYYNSGTSHTFSVDTAPTFHTENSHTVYIEANLIKNHTFHHSSDEVNPTVEVGSNQAYKVNNWLHTEYNWSVDPVSGLGSCGNNYNSSVQTWVRQMTSAGFWDEYEGQKFAAAKRYPKASTDSFIKITSTYKTAGTISGVVASDLKIPFNDAYKSFSRGDIVKISSEYLEVERLTTNYVYVKRALYGSDAAAYAGSTDIKKNINANISQDIDKNRLKKGQTYVLTFYAKDSYASSKWSKPKLSLTLNGGYFDKDGNWNEAISDWRSQGINTLSAAMQEQRWINFEDITEELGDDENPVPTAWKKFEYKFHFPKNIDLQTNLSLALTNKGEEGSIIQFDQMSMYEYTPLIVDNKNIEFKTVGNIDNKGKKDLVIYDYKNKDLRVVKDFKESKLELDEINVPIEKSPHAATTLIADNDEVEIINRNREVHIGFGSNSGSAKPQWLGYLNRKVFNKDETGTLYQDEDTVHSYDETGIVALNKLVLAGEHEYLRAYYNHTTSTADGEGATLAQDTLRIYHNSHRANVGDNVMVRLYGDTSISSTLRGVWVINAISANYFDLKVKGGQGPVISYTSGATSLIRINWRPYYYYGMKLNDYHLYRVFPKGRIDESSLGISDEFDSFHKIGKIQKSLPLSYNVQSIATCHNKITNTTTGASEDGGGGGGMIYVLTNSTANEVKVIDVQAKYNEWETLPITEQSTQTLQFKSYKWSNDHLNGNINGDTAVYDSLASESTPNIEYSGLLSDIIETKGPNQDYVHETTSLTGNPPDHYDTRLWVQSIPGGEQTFTSGDRFLFCGRTEGATSTTGIYTTGNISLGDRTPPTNMVQSEPFRWDGSNDRFNCGPGIDGDYFNSEHAGGSKKKLDVVTPVSLKDNPISYSVRSEQNPPVINYGENVGWESQNEDTLSIRLARFGLMGMYDNDGDGVIDGTGVVVPSTTTLPSSPVNNQDSGPYGKYHERVTAHVVSILGSSQIEWVRNWGAHDGCNHKITSGDRYYQGAVGRAPENMEATKCLFVCSDIHFGDKIPELETTDSTYAQHHITATGAAANGRGTRFTVATGIVDNLQQGDPIFIHDKGADTAVNVWSDDENNSAYIVSIDSATTFTVNVAPQSNWGSGTLLFPGTKYMFHYSTNLSSNGNQSVENFFTGSLNTDHPHWAYDNEDKLNSSIFADAKYSKTWFTCPSSKGLSTYEEQEWDTQYVGPGNNYAHGFHSKFNSPGILFKLDRLNYRAGYMIRPFDLDDETFEDLVIGNGTFIDMPGKPDSVFHTKDGSKHDSWVNTTIKDNAFASRIYLTSPVPDTHYEKNQSKIYIIDPKFQFPNDVNQLQKQRGINLDTNDWNGDWASHTPYVYGTLTDNSGDGSKPYVTTSATTTNAHRFAENYPAIIIPDGTISTAHTDPNGIMYGTGAGLYSWATDNQLTGMMLTVVCQTTGTMETRYIVGSSINGDKYYINLHYPLGRVPEVNDLFYIWDHSYACTATMRLFKETDLKLSTGIDATGSQDGNSIIAYKADPISNAPLFKGYGNCTDMDADGATPSVVTITTDEEHLLMGSDTVELFECTEDSFNGIYEVTVTDPHEFRVTLGITTGSTNKTGKWKIPGKFDSDSQGANPILVPMKSPVMVTNYGGSDFKVHATEVTENTDITDAGGAGTTDFVTTKHHFTQGVPVHVNQTSGTSDFDGIYPTSSLDEDTIVLANTAASASELDEHTVRMRAWEHIVMDTAGKGLMSKIYSGLNFFSGGGTTYSMIRAGSNELAIGSEYYMNWDESSVKIYSTSVGNNTGDYFKKSVNYEYKVSFIYDGYQEGPLSSSTWNHYDTSNTQTKLDIEISINSSNFSKRLSDVCLYRRNNSDSFFKLVKQIPVATGWSYDGERYIKRLTDDGSFGATYEARVGRSEILDEIRVKYGMSAEIDGYLFVGDCSHSQIDDASNIIFRSRPGQYSIFDYSRDFIQLKSKPTAMANFGGRLYVFDKHNIYRINQQNLAIEDTFEGIGCSGQNSIVVTEYGMFFADSNGAYMHNGTQANKISMRIEDGGTSEGWTLDDLSWNVIGKSSLAEPPLVTYDSSSNSILFIVKFVDYNSTLDKSIAKHFAWSYSLLNKRWDLWEVCEDSTIGTPFIGDEGGLFIPINNSIFEYKGGTSKRRYTWLSKKLNLDEDSIGKVFNKVKINGIPDDLNSLTSDDDKLIVITSAGQVSESDMTYSSVSDTDSQYRIKGSNKKGRWIQIKLKDMNKTVDSIGLIWRRKATK